MKSLVLRIFALVALLQGALFAEDLTGAWQGIVTVRPGDDRRTVFKISKGEDGALKAVFYLIDQGGRGFGSRSVTLQGSSVNISIAGIDGTYEGKLSADGNSMTGIWTLQNAPRPLTLQRATAQTAWTIPEPPAPPKAMAANADPTFEVATIKPTKPGTQGRGFRISGRRFTTVNTSLIDLMTFAYGLHPRQVTGGPTWTESDKFDLAAQPDGEGQPNDQQWKRMVEKLLADRFQLTFHHEQKELAVYAIVVAKNGPKLTKSEGDPNGLPALFFHGLGTLPARNATMADFASVMQRAVLDRPVVDHTELKGRWDFTLTWTPDETQFTGLGVRIPPPPDSATAPDLFAAIQQQLGLKLESTKERVDVLVIDHVEKPSEN